MGAVLLLGILATTIRAAEPERTPANLHKACDRACLVGIMDQYMGALYQHDPKAVPKLALDYRMTENTGVMTVTRPSTIRLRAAATCRARTFRPRILRKAGKLSASAC
jgi:hypothetical protein